MIEQETNTAPPTYWRVADVCRHLGNIATSSFYRYRENPDFPKARMLGNVPLFVPAEIIAYVESQKVAA